MTALLCPSCRSLLQLSRNVHSRCLVGFATSLLNTSVALFCYTSPQPVNASYATQMIAHAGFSGRWKVLVGTLGDVLPELKETLNGSQLDFVFIDHHKDMYLSDALIIKVWALCVTVLCLGMLSFGWY